MSTSPVYKKWLVITGALLLVVGIALLPRKPKDTNTGVASLPAFSVEEHVKEQIKGLPNGNAQTINSLVGSLSAQERASKVKATDSLSKIADRLSSPLIGAFYYEKLALELNEEKLWLNAAYRYFDAYRLSRDSTMKSGLLDKAIGAYNKVITLNPENLDAKTDLGVCYTETAQPMKGITLLREVITKNPRHENALMDLGMLSMRSRQYEKGIDRFKQVIEINKNNPDAFLYLGECYIKTGKQDLAVENLQHYKDLIKNKDQIAQVDELIQGLQAKKK